MPPQRTHGTNNKNNNNNNRNKKEAKEAKESVVYPPSKRKVPAFKPLRPASTATSASGFTSGFTSASALASASTLGTGRAGRAVGAGKGLSGVQTAKRARLISGGTAQGEKMRGAGEGRRVAVLDSDEEEDEDEDGVLDLLEGSAVGEDSDGEMVESHTLGRPAMATKAALNSRKATTSKLSSRSAFASALAAPAHEPSDSDHVPGAAGAVTTTTTAMGVPVPTQSDEIPSIPQPLLLRLLHEAFVDKNTKIDKHAIQVLQKYIEIFVREAIARAQLEKQQAMEQGDVSELDAGWLELEDLEKAAPSLFLDF